LSIHGHIDAEGIAHRSLARVLHDTRQRNCNSALPKERSRRDVNPRHRAHEGGIPMRKSISLAIAAVILLAAVGTWAVARVRPDSHAKVMERNNAPASLGGLINPFEMMKNAKELPHEQFDAH
jgi:hypothetical protein